MRLDSELASAADLARRLKRTFGHRAAVQHALRTDNAAVKFAVLVTVTPLTERRALLDELDRWSACYWRWRPNYSDWLDERLLASER